MIAEFAELCLIVSKCHPFLGVFPGDVNTEAIQETQYNSAVQSEESRQVQGGKEG